MAANNEPFRGRAIPKVVDPFDAPVAADGTVIADPFDQPEIDYSKVGEFQARNASEKQQWIIALAYIDTPDTAARADIIKKALPGSIITQDPEGRHIVSFKGETGYIDKPGVTLNGVIDSVAGAAKYIPAGKLAGLGRNLLTRSLIAGTAGAATSVAEDVGAGAMGSEQGISPEKAIVTGAAGTVAQPVGEKIVTPALAWAGAKGLQLWKQLRGIPNAVDERGTLTDVGRRMAAEAGLDPDQMTPQLARELEAAARAATQAGVGAEAAGTTTANQALSRRFNVPLTKGEVTGDFKQQSLEENLRRMDVTTGAGQIMRSAETDSAAALRGANGETGFGQLSREVAGRQAGTDVADAGQTVLRGVQRAGAADKGAYQAQYKTARESGAALDARNYKDFLGNTRNVLTETIDYDAALMPKTAQMLAHLEKQGVWFEEMGKQAARKLPLTKLENTRKLINAMWKSADDTDRIGLNVLREQYDEMVNGALDSGRVIGDKAAVQAWSQGRALFQRFRELYAANPKDGQAEQTAGRAVANWLKSDNVTGEEVIRGALNNKALTQRILTIAGENSVEHQALKQGVLELVFRPALKNDAISPRLVVSQFDRYFRGANKEQLAAIFSPGERMAIAEFVQLAKAKIPQKGIENFSNSGNVMARGLQQLGQKLGLGMMASGDPVAAGVMTGAGVVGRTVKSGQARAAAAGLTPRGRAPVPVTAGVEQGASEKD